MRTFIKLASQRGVGMIELLVAVFILSIGLLGMAGLQAVSLKNNNDSLNRSYATFLSSSIIDRIRANPSATYTIALDAAPPVKADSCEGSSSNCNNAQLAQYDLATWKCSLGSHNDDSNCAGEPAGLLNNGQGSIAVSGNEYTITINWTERLDAEGSPITTSFVTRTQL